jgi:hypothetical protein
MYRFPVRIIEYGKQKEERIINDFMNHQGSVVDCRLSAGTTRTLAMSPIQATREACFSDETNEKILRSRFCQTAHFRIVFLNFNVAVQFAAHHAPCPLMLRPTNPA